MDIITTVVDVKKCHIESVSGDLALIHYDHDATDANDLKHRGTVIDTKEKMVIATNPGFTPVIVTDVIDPSIKEWKDVNGNTLTLDLSKLKYRIGREGALIKVFKHNGTVYISSCKKLDVSNSRLGQSKTFEEMYIDLGGPVESLFGPELYSPYCHVFILSHQDLLIGSKINMINCEGFLYYLGYNTVWTKAPESWTSIEAEPKVPRDVLESDWIPLDVANKHLKFGFHPIEHNEFFNEPRLTSGEFVVAYDEQTQRWYRFESQAYHWRRTIHEGEVNLRYGFYKHLTAAKKAIKGLKDKTKQQDYLNYLKQFPLVPNVDPKSIEMVIQAKGYIISWPGNRVSDKTLEYNTWACYLLACPIHLHKEIAGYYNDYFLTCNYCAQKIFSIWRGNVSYDKTKANTNAELRAVRRIDDIIAKSQEPGKREKASITPEIVKRNCTNLVRKEHGETLYVISEFLHRHC